jgi:insulysin
MISINKPQFDTRDFVGGILDNGIKYVIIHDPLLTSSFVSIAVNIGTIACPKGYDGLPHFLEHMLFMGSGKYPNVNHYFEKLNQYGGFSNAYTDILETVYYFNVLDHGLLEIIDIFSRFFIDPLFNKDAIAKEINAVDSEHQKNINSDGWRQMQLLADLADDDTPINIFGTGSHNTLNKPGIRDELIKFYKKYYTSTNTSICIASSKSHSYILTLIKNTFGHIKKPSKSNTLIISQPCYTKNKGKTIYMKSLMNIYDVSYNYEIPFQLAYIYSHDFSIFTSILTIQSEESFYFHLKNMGYIKNILADITFAGMLSITLYLTKEGYSNMQYCEHLLFDAIKQIINMDIKKYAIYFSKICNIQFDNLNKFDTESLCNLLSVNHIYYKTQNVFDGFLKFTQIKTTDEYSKLYSKYINNKNVIKIICAQDYPGIIKHIFIKAREYKTEYTFIDSKFKDTTHYTDVFNIDTLNDYLDVSPKLFKSLDTYNVPTLIGDKLWYGGCSKFGEPTVFLYYQLNNINYFNTPKKYILTTLVCSVLNFLISIIMYKAFQVYYNITFTSFFKLSTIGITINGLNDFIKLEKVLKQFNIFLQHVDKHFLKLDEKYINNLIVSLKEYYLNIIFLNPFEYAEYLVSSKADQEYNINELLNAIDTITYSDIHNHILQLFDKTALTTFIYGNIPLDSIKKLFNVNSSSLLTCLLSNHIYPLLQTKLITDMIIKHPNKDEKSNLISYYYKIGTFTPKYFGMLIVLHKIIKQLFFDILRSEKQLGYIVKLLIHTQGDEYYITEKIQSGKPIKQIMKEINEFNKNIQMYIKNSEFEKVIKTVILELNAPEYNIDDKINKYLPEIIKRTYLFNRTQLILNQVKQLTKDDILEFAKCTFDKSNKVIVVINGN